MTVVTDHLSEQQLRGWLARTLSDDEMGRVEDHLETCENCAERLGALETETVDGFLKRVRGVMEGSEDPDTNRQHQPTTDSGRERPGKKIGPYKLLQKLGEGGMGTVWMAEQDHPVRRVVALKIIKAGMDTKEVIARFETERQALAMMDHPNVARVLDAGETETGRPYFAMELVKGVPITNFCDQKRMTTRDRLGLFCEICRAVQHAHRKGIIHRDIKPSNILVSQDEDEPLVKIIDFGLAKATGAKLTERTLFTALGQMVGTPAYMSPEQAELSGLDVDTRTDVYSLGVLLYELLTGFTPLDLARLKQAGYADLQRMIREEDPPLPSTRISSLNNDSSLIAQRRNTDPRDLVQMLRGDVDVIVMKALEKDRGRRYESPGRFADDIRRYLQSEPIHARPASITYRLNRLYRRNKLAVTAGVLIFISLLTGTAVSTVLALRAMNAEDVANTALDGVKIERDRAIEAEGIAEKRRVEVENEQKKTQVALEKAEAALAEAESVTKLVVDVFRSPDPLRDGATIRVAEMLDRFVDELDQRTDLEPGRMNRLKQTIASTYASLGIHEKAIPLREQAVAYLTDQGLDLQATAFFNAKLDLANSYQSVGRDAEGLAINEDLLEYSLAEKGVRHPTTLTIRNNLANCLPASDPRCKEFREENVEIAIELYGKENATTLLYMYNLAYDREKEGRIDDAIVLHEEVLSLSRKVLGDEHPDTLRSIRELLDAYRDADILEKEVPLAEENLRISRKLLGDDNSYTQRAMARMSRALGRSGRVDEGLALREELLSMREKLYGKSSQQTRFTANQMIIDYGVYGRPTQALETGRRMLETCQAELGEDHESVWKTKNLTAFAIALTDKADDEEIRIALAMAEEVCSQIPKTATAWNTLAMVRFRSQDWQGTIEAAERSIELSDGKGDWSDRLLIAAANWQAGNRELATTKLAEAEAWIKAQPSVDWYEPILKPDLTAMIHSD